MATIRKRNGKWQVQIRRCGERIGSRTFHLKADAIAWGRLTENEIDREGVPADRRILRTLTVADLLQR